VVFSRLTDKRFENWGVNYKQSLGQIFFPRFVGGWRGKASDGIFLSATEPQPGLFTADSHRGASLSGRGQWACTLRRPAYLSGEA